MTSNPASETVFRALHERSTPLVLVNAWDAASARLFEEAGCAAIATTSAGIAWSLGYSDGEAVSRAEMLSAVARICRVVSVPVSVDIERGFGATTAEVRDMVTGLADLGVVGINIEDGLDSSGALVDSATLVARLEAIRDLKERRGLAMFVNARSDVYFANWQGPASRHEKAHERYVAYRAAGADGLFFPGISVLAEIARLVQVVEAPLNVYAGIPGMPTLDELTRAGVRRISVGCAPLQTLLGSARRLATEALERGSIAPMVDSMLSASEINSLFV